MLKPTYCTTYTISWKTALFPELTVHSSPISSLSLLTIHPPSPSWAYWPSIPHLQAELPVHPSPISRLSLLTIHPPSPSWASCPPIPHLQAELPDHPSPISSLSLLTIHPPSPVWAIRTHHDWPSQMHENLLISRVKTQAIASVLMPLINKFECICEGHAWWVCIILWLSSKYRKNVF